MTNTAAQGRLVEHKVRDHLTRHGYDVVRAAASKGPADLVAFGDGHVLVVNVKRTTPPGPAERHALLAVAARIPGVCVPLVALKPARSPIEFRELLPSGGWAAWSADLGGSDV